MTTETYLVTAPIPLSADGSVQLCEPLILQGGRLGRTAPSGAAAPVATDSTMRTRSRTGT